MKLSIRLLFRNYSALFGGELLSKIAGFLAFAYLARVLEPHSYGIVEFAVALSMVGMLVVDFGLGPVGCRKLTTDPSTGRGLAGHIPAARLLLAVLAFTAMCGFGLVLTDSSKERAVVGLFALGLLTFPWTLNWLLQGLDQIPWVAPAQSVRMLAYLGGVLLLVKSPEHLLRVGGIELAGLVLMAGYYLVAAYSKVNIIAWPRFDGQAIRKILKEAMPVGCSQLLWVLNLYLPTLFIAGFLAVDDVAYYGAAHRIVVSLGSFVFLYFFNLYPTMVRATENGSLSFGGMMITSLSGTTWLGLFGAVVAVLAATPVCRLIYGEAFAVSGPLLAVILWSLPINLISGHARFALIAAGHQTLELAAQAAGVIVTLGLAAVLIPIAGTTGAAITIVASSFVVWVVAHVFACRAIERFPFARPLVRPLGAVSVALAMACLFGPPDPWIRIALAAGIFIAVAFALEPRFRQAISSVLRT